MADKIQVLVTQKVDKIYVQVTQNAGVTPAMIGNRNDLETINKSNLVAAINEVNAKVVSGGVTFIKNEIPQGLVNGSNALYTSAFNFVPESVEVILNGLNQQPIVEFTTIGTNQIQLNFSPLTGELILINYLKA